MAMVESAVTDLKRFHRQSDIDFFLDAKRSEIWIVGAGLDYDAVLSRLKADGDLIAELKPLIRKDFLKKVTL
jgi:hypothetical protein